VRARACCSGQTAPVSLWWSIVPCSLRILCKTRSSDFPAWCFQNTRPVYDAWLAGSQQRELWMYHLRDIIIMLGTMGWLRFTYIFESRSAE
jgi:hypothetical protein